MRYGNIQRLDRILVELGLARSRAQAQQAIKDRRVLVDGHVAGKASALVNPEEVELLDPDPYFSRAAHKLAAANMSALTLLDLAHQAFAGDPTARPLAEQALARGWDRLLLPVQRVFAYLPFEHSEALADQERSLALFAALAAEQPGYDGYLDYARRHHEVIARFGRFPHRNAALGRPDTPEEADYLAQPGSGF